MIDDDDDDDDKNNDTLRFFQITMLNILMLIDLAMKDSFLLTQLLLLISYNYNYYDYYYNSFGYY